MAGELSLLTIGGRRRTSRVLVAMFGLFLLACGTSSSGQTDAVNDSPGADAGRGSITSAVQTSQQGPSESALMICSTEAREAVASSLALSSMPAVTPAWQDGLYTCTYALAAGPLILSVKEFGDVAAAQQHLEALQREIAPAEQLAGLASLGLPGYQSADGDVIFLKDAMTLHVDATALPAQLGPDGVSKSDFAYQIATIILACWRGH